MKTAYYDLSTRRLKVSGGADLVTLTPAPVELPQETAGQLLNFERCRRQLETRAALRAMGAASGQAPEAPAPRPRSKHREVYADWLELCASAAVLVVGLIAAGLFFGL